MEILERKVNEISILSPCGRLDAYSSSDLEKKLNELTDKAPVRVIVNMDKLEYISSSGLRVLLAALKKSKKQQGDVRLACMQPYVKEVFEIAGFLQLFSVFEKEEEAINSFK